MRLVVILCLGVALHTRSAEAFTGDTNAQAAQRGINEVTADAVSFGQSQGCVACHRQGASLYGLAHSNASGFTVDLSDTTGIGVLASEIATDQYPGGYWLHAGWQYPNAKGSYAMFGLAGYDAYVSTAYSSNIVAGADWAVTDQDASGRWVEDHGDYPTTFGDIPVTSRFMVGIAQAQQRVDPSKAAKYQAALDSAAAYLIAHQADNNAVLGTPYNYELSWDLIGLMADGLADNDTNVVAVATALQARESNLTFAWGPTAGDAPDAFSTGMALYALCTAGVAAAGNPNLISAISWLNDNQDQSGSWGSDIPSTFAVLGLSCYGDYGVGVKNSGAKTAVIAAASMTEHVVVYDLDVSNRGFDNDLYTLAISGGAAGWTAVLSDGSDNILPGQHKIVHLTVTAPAGQPSAMAVQFAVTATSTGAPKVSSTATVTTYSGTTPPIVGDATALTLTAGSGATVLLNGTQALSATVLDTTTQTAINGAGKGVVAFFVGGLPVGIDTDADSDGTFSVTFAPSCDYTHLGAQDLRAIYYGIDFQDATITNLLSSLASSTITINQPACCPRAEICDGIDNDCDGTIDNGYSIGTACSVGVGVGACAATGMIACATTVTSACSAVAGAPSAELCDGIDNDCNGTIDNGYSLDALCAVGVGECATQGGYVCQADGSSACGAIAGQPVSEICGDAKDNDCDGVVDNGCAIAPTPTPAPIAATPAPIAATPTPAPIATTPAPLLAASAECGNPTQCASGVCAADRKCSLPSNVACHADNECRSGTCADSVCAVKGAVAAGHGIFACDSSGDANRLEIFSVFGFILCVVLRRRKGVALAVVALSAGVAQASERGFALDRYVPADAGSGWLTAESLSFPAGDLAVAHESGLYSLAVRLDLDYANDPLIVRTQGGLVAHIVHDQLMSDLSVSIVPGRNFRLSLALPVQLYAAGQSSADASHYEAAPSQHTALGDLRAAATYRFFEDERARLGLTGRLSLPTGERSAYSGDGALGGSLAFNAAGEHRWLAWSASLGARLRNGIDSTFASVAIGPELFLQPAAGWQSASHRWLLGVEIPMQMSITAPRPFTSSTVAIEPMLGAHWSFTREWRLHAAVGFGLTKALGMPIARCVLALQWSLGVLEAREYASSQRAN